MRSAVAVFGWGVVACLAAGIAGCGDSATGSSNAADSGGERPIVRLSVSETIYGGQYELDGSGTTMPADRRHVGTRFLIEDLGTGDERAIDHASGYVEPRLIYLSPGRYSIRMEVETTRRDSGSTETAASVSSVDVTSSSSKEVEATSSTTTSCFDDASKCCVTCGEYDGDTSKGYCAISSSTFSDDGSTCSGYYGIALTELESLINGYDDSLDADSEMCIRAMGAKGVTQSTSGGVGGDGGVAQTLSTLTSLKSTASDVYFLLGNNGASTAVTLGDPASTCDGSDGSCSIPYESGVLLVVAGGGGGGTNKNDSAGSLGGPGGVGGSVQAYVDDAGANDCQMTAGNAGGTASTSKNASSGGGRTGSFSSSQCSSILTSSEIVYYAEEGDGVSDDHDGSSGVGGSGSGRWYNYDDSSDKITAGAGGAGDSGHGDGGGGFGGGAGGYHYGYDSEGDVYTAGGGGGSFATSPSSDIAYSGSGSAESWCDDSGYKANSSTYGAVYFIFHDND